MSVSAMRALAVAAEEGSPASGPPQLSTDYLNRYGEALMLIEIAPMDPGVVDDLNAWRPVGYRQHFERSQLRCAAAALAAYDGLDASPRQAFETLCRDMDRLIETVTALLGEPHAEAEADTIVEVACEALRRQIGRATQFINQNGRVDIAAFGTPSLQDDIDAMFAS